MKIFVAVVSLALLFSGSHQIPAKELIEHDLFILHRDINKLSRLSEEERLAGGAALAVAADGDPGARCRNGQKGTCGSPDSCSGGTIVPGHCSGGSENVCCVKADAGASSSSGGAGTDSSSTTSTSTASSASVIADVAAVGNVPATGWVAPTFEASPAPTSDCKKVAVPDVNAILKEDKMAQAVADLAAARSAWSKGKETLEQAKQNIITDALKQIPYIINRVIINAKHKDNCAAQAKLASYLPKAKREFLIGCYNKARFSFIPQKVGGVGVSKPTGGPEPITDESVVSGSTQQKVAPCVIAAARAMKAMGGVNFGTYIGHSWGPYSLDAFVQGGVDSNGFYSREKVLKVLGNIEAASKSKGFKYRVLYDDFDVAVEFNRKVGARKIPGFVWNHGPQVLHLHLDIQC